jgi:hypothetical protein
LGSSRRDHRSHGHRSPNPRTPIAPPAPLRPRSRPQGYCGMAPGTLETARRDQGFGIGSHPSPRPLADPGRGPSGRRCRKLGRRRGPGPAHPCRSREPRLDRPGPIDRLVLEPVRLVSAEPRGAGSPIRLRRIPAGLLGPCFHAPQRLRQGSGAPSARGEPGRLRGPLPSPPRQRLGFTSRHVS